MEPRPDVRLLVVAGIAALLLGQMSRASRAHASPCTPMAVADTGAREPGARLSEAPPIPVGSVAPRQIRSRRHRGHPFKRLAVTPGGCCGVVRLPRVRWCLATLTCPGSGPLLALHSIHPRAP